MWCTGEHRSQAGQPFPALLGAAGRSLLSSAGCELAGSGSRGCQGRSRTTTDQDLFAMHSSANNPSAAQGTFQGVSTLKALPACSGTSLSPQCLPQHLEMCLGGCSSTSLTCSSRHPRKCQPVGVVGRFLWELCSSPSQALHLAPARVGFPGGNHRELSVTHISALH